MRLNDVALRAIPAPAKGQTKVFDDSLHGFGIRVSQGGTRTFFLQVGSDRRFISLGRYPLISLQDARSEAKRLLAEFTLGRLRPQSLSYAEAVHLFLADKAKNKRPRTVEDYRRHLAKHFPFKGQLIDISHGQIAHRLERLSGTPAEHNHARTVAISFFNWCLKRRYVIENPVVGISPHARPPRQRVLDDAELRAIWNACEGRFGDFIRLDSQLGVAFLKKKQQTPAAEQAKLAADEVKWIRERNQRCNLVGQDAAPIGTLAISKICMIAAIQQRIKSLNSDKSEATILSKQPEANILTLKPGTYVANGTQCAQASNSVIMNFDGQRFLPVMAFAQHYPKKSALQRLAP